MIFLQHLRDLLADPSSPPTPAVYDQLWAIFFRRVSALCLKPVYLGYSGEWNALRAEAVADCYQFVYFQRFRYLADAYARNCAEGHPDRPLEPLVLRMIQTMISHLQREYDPIGHRIHGFFVKAVRTLIARDIFAPAPRETAPAGSLVPVRRDSWFDIIKPKPHATNPSPITAAWEPEWSAFVPRLTATDRGVPTDLTDYFVIQLADTHTEFRFGDLIDAAMADVRTHVRQTITAETDTNASAWDEKITQVKDCVYRHLAKSRPERTRRRRQMVWDVMIGVIPATEPIRSYAAMARVVLQISGEKTCSAPTIENDFQVLAELVAQCRDSATQTRI